MIYFKKLHFELDLSGRFCYLIGIVLIEKMIAFGSPEAFFIAYLVVNQI